MLTILKSGQILLKDKIVCNRPGPIVDVIMEEGTNFNISPNIKNPYTVSIASQGILLSFYAIKKKLLQDYDIDLAWFVDFEYAYFLSTSNSIDGYNCYWNENIPFGKIFTHIADESHFQQLDKTTAWTFFLDLATMTLTLSYVWNSDIMQFIIPSKWNVPKFCNEPKFIVEKNGKFENMSVEEKMTPIIIHDKLETKQCLVMNCPLLVTIYSSPQNVYNIRIISKTDMLLLKIKSRSIDKYIALLIAKFKDENIEMFINNNFTIDEINMFDNALNSGFEEFKNDIYKKVVLHKWVQFPDKIFNTIRLGDIIIDKTISVEEKYEKAVEELKKCTFGWKLKALYEFYKFYMKI